ncbi:MAG: cytochrome P450 [Dehalococcoidia bacterium]
MTTDTGATKQLPTGIQLTPLDPEFQREPYPILAQMREAEPVHYDSVLKRWLLFRAEEVDALLRDRSLAVNPKLAGPGSYMAMFLGGADFSHDGEPNMLFADPPYHTRLRSLVTKAFSARAVEAMAPRIQEIVDELLDAVEGSAGFDLIASFAAPLPTIVIAEMLGVDPADRDDFKRWSDIGIQGFDPTLSAEKHAEVRQAEGELDAYLERVLEERKQEPRDDLISMLIAAEVEGDHLSDHEIMAMVSLLLAAGNVTTTDLIGNGVLALVTNRSAWQKLQADPSLIKNAVEEMLRYDSPVTQTGRIPLADTTIGGCPMRAGDSITPSLAAANHDPALNPDPERFDITRQSPKHFSFGGGVHYCLGAPLARLEAQIAVLSLVRRFPNLRIAGEALEWRRIPSFRGLAKLPMIT